MTPTDADLFTTPLQQALLGPQGAAVQAAARRRLDQLQADLHACMGAGLPRDTFSTAERLMRMLEQAQQLLASLPCHDGRLAFPPFQGAPR